MQQDKYLEALKKHPFTIVESKVSEKVEKIINDKYADNNNIEVYKKIYSCIDLTTLNSTDSREDAQPFLGKGLACRQVLGRRNIGRRLSGKPRGCSQEEEKREDAFHRLDK